MSQQAHDPKTDSVKPAGKDEAKTSRSIYLWLATVPIVWGFNFVGLKVLYAHGFTVPALLSMRYIIMAVALGVCLLVLEDDPHIDREDWKYLGIFALVTVVIYQFVFAKGIEMTTPAESSLLISTAPIWVFLISLALRIEKFERVRMLGVIVGFLGVGMVIFGREGVSLTNLDTNLAGDLVMTAAAILWASYAVFSRPLLKKYSPMKLVAYMHILGSLIIIPAGFQQLLEVGVWDMGLVPWLCILHYSILAGVYGFLVWYAGVQSVGAGQTMLYQYFVPVVALVAGYLVLQIAPTWMQIAGVIITLGGVHLARQHSRSSSEHETGET